MRYNKKRGHTFLTFELDLVHLPLTNFIPALHFTFFDFGLDLGLLTHLPLTNLIPFEHFTFFAFPLVGLLAFFLVGLVFFVGLLAFFLVGLVFFVGLLALTGFLGFFPDTGFLLTLLTTHLPLTSFEPVLHFGLRVGDNVGSPFFGVGLRVFLIGVLVGIARPPLIVAVGRGLILH